MDFFDYKTKAQYSDLGEDGFLSPAGMLRLMQEAACEHSASVGCAPGELMERMGVGWILCGWKLQAGRKVPWGTELTVRTWPRRMDIHFSDRDFLILDRDGETERKIKVNPERRAAEMAEAAKEPEPQDDEPTKRLSIDLEHLQFGKDYEIK